VTNYGDGNVSSYVINSSTGALTAAPGSPFDTGQFPSAVTVVPSGRFTYVAIPCAQLDCSSGTVSAYAVNSTTGALREIAGSPFNAGKEVNSLAMDPTGRFLYTANLGDGTISAYSINGSTGALGALAGSPFAAGNATISVALDPSDHFLYVANQCQSAKGCAHGCQSAKSCAHGNVSAYTIDSSTGTLTPVPGAPIATGNTSWSVAIASQAQTTSALTLNPHALVFDNTPINTSSAVQTVTVTNTTANTVAITGIGLRGKAPKQFAFTGDCGKSLAGNAVCTIQVNFAPTTTGLKTAFLDVNGGGGGLRSVKLTGTGT
jgi:6-phosphogluconolactonase (cycloisomerase 2 family)